MKPPIPEEWHPAYDDREDVRDWLNGRGPHAARECFHLVEAEPIPYESFADPPVIESRTFTRITLERKLARGWAPYVGRPFYYEWICAVDQFGRGVAGRARRVYDEFREAIEFDGTAQDMLAITGAAVGQCDYCGSYRADGIAPLVHERDCPWYNPRYDPSFRTERARPKL